MTKEVSPQINAPTVAALARADHRVADVLLQYGINYCCSGGVTMRQACTVRGVPYETVQTAVTAAQQKESLFAAVDAKDWPLHFLTDYAVHVQHCYFKKTLPLLQQQLQQFVASHQKKQPTLLAISAAFTEVSNSITAQMQQEEELIFPYIKQVETAHRRHESYASLFVRTLRKPLDVLEENQSRMQASLRQLRQLTNNYECGTSACTNQVVIFKKLAVLDQNLQRHALLEGDVLYPKLVETEAALLQ